VGVLIDSKTLERSSISSFRYLCHKTVSKLYQNLLRRQSCIKTPPKFIGLAAHLLKCFSLHLEFHLRVLLEHL